MKIAIIIDQLLPGGVQNMAIQQTRELIKQGHSAKLIILMRKNFSQNYESMLTDVPYQFLSDSYPRAFRTSIKFPLFSFFSTLHLLSPLLAPRYFNATQNSRLTTHSPLPYDLIISHGTTTCLTTQAIYRRHSIPYIAIIHDPITYILTKVYHQTKLRLLFPLLLPLATHLEKSFTRDALDTILISTVHQSHFQTKYGIFPQILPLGVTTSGHLPNKRGRHILSFGRWETEKHPEFLLEVASLLPNLRLVIAGSWTNPRDLQVFQKKLLHHPNVTLITHYTDQQLYQLCQQSFVWIYPNFESFSLAALEAAAQGLPIIIPSGSGISELLQDQTEGFFPLKKDPKIYAKIIKHLHRHPHLAYQIGKQAAEKIKSHFSWKKHTQKLIGIINHHRQKHQLLALELAHVLSGGLSGGDRLLQGMSEFLPQNINLTVLTTHQGSIHWQNHSPNFRLERLPSLFWDKYSQPVPIFFSYIFRIFQSTRRILTLPFISSPIIYSSTNILTDIAPAFLYTLLRPRSLWIARIHHLILPPRQRPGRLLVNTISYTMQILANIMIKSKSTITISLNKHLTQQLITQGFDKHRLVTIGAGINLQKIQSAPPSSTHYTGIYLGRLHPAKGIQDLIPIWTQVAKKQPQAKLGIIGTGNPEQIIQFRHMIKSAGLIKQIHILGYLPDLEVYSYLKSAKIFLATDHEAGFGIAIAEAMGAGLPVIGYQLPIFGSVFKQGYITVPLADTQSFANQINYLLDHNSEYLAIKTQALQQAHQFSWSTTANKFTRLVHNLHTVQQSKLNN